MGANLSISDVAKASKSETGVLFIVLVSGIGLGSSSSHDRGLERREC